MGAGYGEDYYGDPDTYMDDDGPRGNTRRTRPYRRHRTTAIPTPGYYSGYGTQREAKELQKLQEELADTPAVAIRKNAEVFERRFKIMEGNIANEMRKIVGREGDRIVSTVLAGPHERILDPVCIYAGPIGDPHADFSLLQDMYEIWKEMVR